MSKNIIIALNLPKGDGEKKCPDCKQSMDNGICHECGYGSEEEEDDKDDDMED